MVIKVGVNGFGRIGRIVSRTCLQKSGFELSAINDPAISAEYMCYLLRFDSTHGKLRARLAHTDCEISVDGHHIKVFHEKQPSSVPWHSAGVEYVVEASGMFTSHDKASGHLSSYGVKRVILAAPSVDAPMYILGVNDHKINPEQKVVSCASSTLYCLAPIIKVLEEKFGVEEGFITSIHAMTPSLKPLDGLCLRGRHWRDHRSIHQNIIPASTSACKALGKIFPRVKDKLSGLAFRVPIVNVSVLDLTIRLQRHTTLQEIVRQVDQASKSTFKNILKVSSEEAVSSDFTGESHSCIFDEDSSIQLNPNFFKIICWYENEYSYACRVIDTITFCDTLMCEIAIKRTNVRPNSPTLEVILQTDSNETDKTVLFKCDAELTPRSLKSARPLTPHTLPTRNTKSPLEKHRDVKNELFKIWNDTKCEFTKPIKQNISSFFQSCIAFAPQPPKTSQCKTQEHLNNVKKEFTKLTHMTEDLLKTSLRDQSRSSFVEIKGEKSSDFEVDRMESDRKFDEKNDDMYSDQSNVLLTCDVSNSKDEVEQVSNNKDNRTEIEISKEIDNTTKIANEVTDSRKSDTLTIKNLIGSFGKIKVNKISTDVLTRNDLNEYASNENDHDKDVAITEITDKVIEVVENRTIEVPIDNCNKEIKLDDVLDSDRLPNGEEDITDKASKYKLTKEDCCIKIIDEKLRKRNIILVNNQNVTDASCNQYDKHTGEIRNLKEMESQKQADSITILDITASNATSRCETSISSCVRYNKQDIYDKLDSASDSDVSNNSFEINERKSQVIQITDLTNSLEDLARLDKICRIIEISDELSDQLFSTLGDTKQLSKTKWSFRDLCDRIKLDDFCNKVFGTSVI